jgi:hypothetical protein
MKGIISQKRSLRPIIALVVLCVMLLLMGVMPMTVFGLDEVKTDAVEAQVTTDDNVALQSGMNAKDTGATQENGTEVHPTDEGIYIERDQEYMTKTFPKYDPTAFDRLIAVEEVPGAGGHYRNSLLFSTIPYLDDAVINEILADIDTVKVVSVVGYNSEGLLVELLLEDESQEKSITERLLADSRITEVEKLYFSDLVLRNVNKKQVV